MPLGSESTGKAALDASKIIGDAGGRVVGRTRLQKIGYLLELSGVGSGFGFEYRHYGPFSEELATAIRSANRLGLLSEEERPTNWGGSYSIFSVPNATQSATADARVELVRQAASADAIELELAATAAFLFEQGARDPWGETERRKPEKAKGRIDSAKALYSRLRQIDLPRPLPDIG